MSFISGVEEISKIQFVEAKKGRPLDAEKIVTVDGIVVAKLPTIGERRRVWTSWEQVHKFALCPGDYSGRSLSLLKGLVALKIIKKEHLTRHMSRVKEIQADDALEYDRSALERLNKRYGANIVIPALRKRTDAVDGNEAISTFDQLKELT